MTTKETFKLIIKEFHERKLPMVVRRSLQIPDVDKVISIVGMRRVGKTYYLFQTIQDLIDDGLDPTRAIYINFEDDRIMPMTMGDMDHVLEAYYELYPDNMGQRVHLFLDEVQNVDGWETFVRRVQDTTDIRTYVTGSSSKMLGRELASGLRGRTLTYEMYPLGFSEFLRFKGVPITKDIRYSSKRYVVKNLFEEYLHIGGFPEIVLAQEEVRSDILSNYLDTMIYRDIVERYSIRNTMLLRTMIKYLMTNTGNLFSVNAYHRSVTETIAAGKETIVEYLSHLEDVGLIHLVPFFSHSLKRQQANPRKAYCADNGLRNAVAFRFSRDDGRLAETLVLLELRRRGHRVSYWKGKGEVDFVIVNDDGSLSAINVSYTDDPDMREFRSLKEFGEEHGGRVRDLLLLTRDTEGVEGDIGMVPIWRWCLDDT